MKQLLILILVLPLAAQTPAPVTPAAVPAAPVAPPVASPVPSAESWLTGYIDLGYQWSTGVGGSYQTYRSIVDLGSGPKLIGADFTILDPEHRLFDSIRVRASDWGDNPYETFHLFADKHGLYELNVDYRRLAYFNDLPSYADPLIGQGTVLDEQSVDTRRTVGAFSLDLFKARMFSPYLGYDRDSSAGTGVSVFETNGDQFAVPDTTRESTNLYRGGIHIKKGRFHINLEEGGTTFRNDQNTYTATKAAPNFGNIMNPVLGQTLNLSGLLQDYGVRGTSVYSKGVFTANPFSWLDVYATIMYSEPRDNLNYKQYNNGNFVLESQVLFYTSEQYLVTVAARLPHTTANVGWEIRPANRIRILQSWSTDRLHDAGSAAQNDTLLNTGVSVPIMTALQSTLATNNSQVETNVIASLNKHVTLRAGYRYVWGNGNDAVLPPGGLLTVNSESIRRQVGLGGATWRVNPKLSLTADVEIGSSGGAYFRTSLYNYRKVRAMAKYQLTNTIHLSINYNILSNRNPNVDADYKFLVHQESAAVSWNPAGKPYNFEGSYEHCVYNSQIGYLVPQTLAAAESIYREDCHTISGYFNGAYKGGKLVAGGSAVLTSGSRPTTYYQPTVKLTYPLRKNVGLFAEWRYYGFGESFYMYESFRTHLFITGLRYSR